MPFDGHAEFWDPGKRKHPARLPAWLPCALVAFGAVMGAVFGFQIAIAAGLFCSMVLSWPNALTTVPAPLFQPFAILGALLGSCVAVWVARRRLPE